VNRLLAPRMLLIYDACIAATYVLWMVWHR